MENVEEIQELVTELIDEALIDNSTPKKTKKVYPMGNKKVLLLGGNGFIGTALNKYLTKIGYEVHVLDYTFDTLNNPQNTYQCNLNSLDQTTEMLRVILDKTGLDGLTIFHLASTVGPELINIDNSINDFKIHFNIYEAIKGEIFRRGETPHKMIFTGSSESYGDIPVMDESKGSLVNVLTEGARPLYSLQKLAAENIFLTQTDYPVVCTRLFNVVGKGQRKDFIFPKLTDVITKNLDCIRNCKMDFEKFQVHGDGLQSRNFISIDDTVVIMEKLINWEDDEEHIGLNDYQINDGIINISCIQNESTILHLVQKFLELFRTVIHNGVKYLTDKSNDAIGLDEYELNSLEYLKKVIALPNEDFIEFKDGLIGQNKRSPLVYKLYKILKYRPKKDLNTLINDMI